MKVNYMVSAALWIAGSIFVVPFASAAEAVQGWYAGGSLGGSKGSTTDGNIVASLAAAGITGTGSNSNNATAGKIFAGYQFNENIALEGGYFNLGSYSSNGSTTAPGVGTFSTSTKYQGGNVDVVGTLPFGGQMSGIGRVGAAYIQGSSSAVFTNAAAGALYGNPSRNKTVVDAGVGLQYQINKTVAGRLEWQRYFNVYNGNSVTANVDFYSLGITVKF